jgi:hypothetical protein
VHPTAACSRVRLILFFAGTWRRSVFAQLQSRILHDVTGAGKGAAVCPPGLLVNAVTADGPRTAVRCTVRSCRWISVLGNSVALLNV